MIWSYLLNPSSCDLLQGFNGADLRNVCTEAGMAAIRAERDYVIHEDFMKVCLHTPVFFNQLTSACLVLTVPPPSHSDKTPSLCDEIVSGRAQAERRQEARVQCAL
jgi:SpoVK/Ycf46/Vps4 family AAA+-type ATPase